MTTTTYLVPRPDVPENKRDRLGQIWHNDKHVYMGVLGLAAGTFGVVSFLMSWFFLLSLGFIGGAAFAFTAPGYYGWHKARGHIAEFTTVKKIDSNPRILQEWSDEIQAICEIQQSLRDFVLTLAPDDFAYGSARSVMHTVEEQLWDSIIQFRKMEPFLRNPRDTTKPVIEAELKNLRRTVEQLQIISDQTLNLAIRSATFVKTAPKDHLEILARELESMCLSLEELDEASSFQLPMQTTSTETYGGRESSRRSTLESIQRND